MLTTSNLLPKITLDIYIPNNLLPKLYTTHIQTPTKFDVEIHINFWVFLPFFF